MRELDFTVAPGQYRVYRQRDQDFFILKLDRETEGDDVRALILRCGSVNRGEAYTVLDWDGAHMFTAIA